MSGKVHRFRTVGSTQDVARSLLADRLARVGDLVVSDSQTAGKGRFGREWSSPVGGLYATFILENRRLLPIKAGVSVLSALDRFGIEAGLKWPNDVLIGKEKLGGMIIETVGSIALVGIGINLLASPIPRSTSTAARGVFIDRDRLLEAIGEELLVERKESDLLAAYRARCLTIGARVSVYRGLRDDPIIGLARGIDDEGRLIVEGPLGIIPVASGECLHLFPHGTDDS